MDSEVVKSKKGKEDELESDKSKKAESSEEKAKGSRKKILGKKRARKEQQQESSKRQRMEDDKETDKNEEVEVDDEVELKKHLVIVKDDDIAIDAIPLATKQPMIVEYKIIKEGIIGHYQLIRADGSFKRYSSVIRMLQDIDKEDLETLWKLVKIKHGDTRPEDEYERVLWGDLKVMFKPDIKSDVWRNLQGYTMTIWKLYDSCGVTNMPRETVGDTSLTRSYILKVSQTPGISPSIVRFYKPIEDRCIHEGRVVDQLYYTSDHIDRCFSNIHLNCLYEINEPIVPRFILVFYSQVTLQRDNSGVILISFMIQNKFITLSFQQFGQILKISFTGQAVFTNEWDLGAFAYSQDTEGPYHTDLPTPEEIHQFL
ncbi:hypothetical protein Tco_0424855 [Tanacetum coccineum]